MVSPRQFFVDAIEQHHIKIGGKGIPAIFTLAEIFAVVRQPDVQNVDFRMRLGVVRDARRKKAERFRPGVTEVGIGGNPLEKAPLSADLRKKRGIHRTVVLPFPAAHAAMQRLRRPAMPHRMIEQTARLDGLQRRPLNFIGVKALPRQKGIVFMRIPTLEKLVGVAELHKVTVESRLGRKCDHVQNIFRAHRALYRNPPVAVAGGKIEDMRALRRGERRQNLTLLSRAQKFAAYRAQKGIDAQQARPRVAADDRSPASRMSIL